MSDFVKDIVKFAKEYRASEQDALSMGRCARMVLDAAHIKEAKEIEAKNIMAMPSHHTKLKRYIIKNFSITRPSRFGEDISDALLNKLDLHHKDGRESGHEIDNSNTSSNVKNYDDFEIRRFMRISQKRLNKIKDEIRKNLIAAGIKTS